MSYSVHAHIPYCLIVGPTEENMSQYCLDDGNQFSLNIYYSVPLFVVFFYLKKLCLCTRQHIKVDHSLHRYLQKPPYDKDKLTRGRYLRDRFTCDEDDGNEIQSAVRWSRP